MAASYQHRRWLGPLAALALTAACAKTSQDPNPAPAPTDEPSVPPRATELPAPPELPRPPDAPEPSSMLQRGSGRFDLGQPACPKTGICVYEAVGLNRYELIIHIPGRGETYHVPGELELGAVSALDESTIELWTARVEYGLRGLAASLGERELYGTCSLAGGFPNLFGLEDGVMRVAVPKGSERAKPPKSMSPTELNAYVSKQQADAVIWSEGEVFGPDELRGMTDSDWGEGRMELLAWMYHSDGTIHGGWGDVLYSPTSSKVYLIEHPLPTGVDANLSLAQPSSQHAAVNAERGPRLVAALRGLGLDAVHVEASKLCDIPPALGLEWMHPLHLDADDAALDSLLQRVIESEKLLAEAKTEIGIRERAYELRSSEAPPVAKLAEVTVKGRLSEERARFRAEDELDDILHCYRRALAVDPDLSSQTLTTRVTVDGQGTATKTTIELGQGAESAELTRCVTEEFQDRTFTGFAEPGTSNVTIRYELLESAPR